MIGHQHQGAADQVGAVDPAPPRPRESLMDRPAVRLAQEGAKIIVNYHSHPEGADDTLKQIRDAHLTLPIIMITDISPQLEFAEHPWIQPVTMLLEPYSSADLLGMVKKALSANASVEGNVAPSPTLKNQPARRGP